MCSCFFLKAAGKLTNILEKKLLGLFWGFLFVCFLFVCLFCFLFFVLLLFWFLLFFLFICRFLVFVLSCILFFFLFRAIMHTINKVLSRSTHSNAENTLMILLSNQFLFFALSVLQHLLNIINLYELP